MVVAAIKCLLKAMQESNQPCSAQRVAKELGDQFGLWEGRDFTLEDIEEVMSWDC